MTEPDLTPEPAERARAGVRSWVRDTGRRARERVQGASPYAILAFLTASAVAPVAGAGLGVSAEFAVALAQLGGLGSNFLADTLAGTAQRMRGTGPITETQWRDAVADDLLPLLNAGDEQSRQLQSEVSALLHGVDAVATALTEAATADDDLRQQLEQAFDELGSDVGALQWMLTDVRRSIDDLRQQFAGQSFLLNQQLEQVRRQLVAVTLEPLPAPEASAGSVPPYPGLASFQPADAPWFRGREAQVAELLARLSEQTVGGPPLVVTGVSGAGKSSLLRAGLLPAIGAGRLGPEATRWPWLVLTPGSTPLHDLVQSLTGLIRHPPTGQTLPSAGEIRREPQLLGRLAGAAADRGRRPVIVVDQFEELFTQCPDPAERLAFAAALTGAAPALVVIAVRSDFYPACVALPPLAELLATGHVVLGPLDAEALRRVVVEPAEQAGLTVDPGLPELMLGDLGADPLGGRPAAAGGGYEPGALPLLAHALRATWERRQGDRLTVEAYRETGGIRHAIAETAERIYLDLTPEDQEVLRVALLSLVTVTSNNTVVRRRGERSPGGSRVLDRLVAERLVTAGTDTVEISHEALLTGWPRLAGWVSEAEADLELRQRVIESAKDWERSGHDPDLLLRGARLLAARERLTDAGGLPAEARAFLAAGAEAAERTETARRRANGRLRRLAAGLAVALLLAVAGGLVAVNQQQVAVEKKQEAQASRQNALSRQYAVEALNALDRDEITAVRRALDGWQESPTVEARGALLSAQMANSIGTLGTEPGGHSAAVSPDGARIAIGYRDGTIRLWDAETLAPIGEQLVTPGEDTQQPVVSVAFSADGRFLLSSALAAGSLQIWDAGTGRSLRSLPGGAAATWLPGTSTVVASRTDLKVSGAQLGMWDAATGRLIRSIPVGDYFAYDITISPDGAYVAIGKSMTAPARVWRLSDGKVVTDIPETVHVAFAPDGTLVGANRFGQLAQWSVPAGKKLRTMIPDAGTPGAGRIATTPDGAVIANNGNRSSVVFSLTGDTKTTQDTGVAAYTAAAVSPDGHLAVVTGLDAPTAVFRRTTTWLRHDGLVLSSSFSPDGRRLATAVEDGRVRVWDTASRLLVTEIRAGGGLGRASYAAGGTLVVATGAHTLEVRDAETGRIRETVPLAGLPNDLATSADGALVAVATGTNAREIFDPAADRENAAEIVLYDVVRREVRGRFRPEPKDTFSPYAVAFSPDGSTLLATLTSSVPNRFSSILRRWHTADFAEAGSLPLGAYQALDLAVSPVDGTLAVAGTSGHVEVRSPDGAQVRWHTPDQIQQVDAVAFAPDGRTIASTEFNGRVHLWDTGSRQLAATLTGHQDRSGALAFSPDSRLLVSSGFEWTFGVWQLDPAVAVHDLCRIEKIASRNEGSQASPLC
ncbi:NACHT and WD repeat domain-containing protein [Actinoplanes palleronii]|uniref:Novel STAND NTPase 1 domain-containing protein n=1 Tax=Actinoplanes palleronii TaxID=113570 RepID=A0ABQ4BFF6_9ACTN|nr:AAA family ATPase [Actinoplanes palleronii]GIE69412.1 hypothetical protein Apa02nite_055200 [Actinoplanes palleronii]